MHHHRHHELLYTNNWLFNEFPGENCIPSHFKWNRCAKPSGNLRFDYYFFRLQNTTLSNVKMLVYALALDDFFLLDFIFHI